MMELKNEAIKYLPEEFKSIEEAYISLDICAELDDDIVFFGITPEDYMHAWNRMIRRKNRHLFFYDNGNDEDPFAGI